MCRCTSTRFTTRHSAVARGPVPVGAKDDPVDAELLLDLPVHHRARLRRLNSDTEQTLLVQHLVEGRRRLVNEKTRQSNRLTAKLKLYFPQILNWFDEVDSRGGSTAGAMAQVGGFAEDPPGYRPLFPDRTPLPWQ